MLKGPLYNKNYISLPIICRIRGGGSWSPSQLTSGERRGTSWTCCQFVVPLTQTTTHTQRQGTVLESPIDLTPMSLDCGKKLEDSREKKNPTHSCRRSTFGLLTEQQRSIPDFHLEFSQKGMTLQTCLNTHMLFPSLLKYPNLSSSL